ncbi:MAG: hypothetical protein K6F79_06285 [Saccharofermentans sp.]|nr:hypothetical protein [Saccharofermentans sp.]
MKKFKNAVALMLAVAVIASMTGCSVTRQDSIEPTESTQTTYLVGSPGSNEVCEFGVTDINSFSITTDYGETMNYLLVGVYYTNLTDNVQDIPRRNVELYLDNEEVVACEYRDEFEEFFDEGLIFSDRKVNPGRTKSGYIVYRIYRDYSIINICLNGITVTADSDEVVPLGLPTEETEVVVEETVPPEPIPEPVVVDPVPEVPTEIDPETGEPIIVEEVPPEEVPAE